MSVDHWKELKELYKSSTINPSENISLQNFGGSSLCKNTEFLNGLNSNTIDICPASFAICLAQFTRLFYSSLQLYLSNEPNVLLGDVNGLYQIISQTIQQLQQKPISSTTVPNTEPSFGANEDSKYDPDEPYEEIKDQELMPPDNDVTNRHDLKDDLGGYPDININEPALSEEVKDEDLFIPQPDNDGIFYKLDEFIVEYNQHRDIAHQISGYAVTRCFMDNIMDCTDFKDLKSNLKRYSIPAGPVRKLWRFLNAVESQRNEDEQDDENVVVIPIGFYMYMPEISDEISFEINDDDDDEEEECIGFKIGDNLSVPSDWSDDDQ